MNKLSEIFELVDAVAPILIEYRLYYDENGKGLFKSGDRAPGSNYVVITKEQFEQVPTQYMSVSDSKIVIKIPKNNSGGNKLVKGQSGFRVAKSNPALIIESTDFNFQTEYYGTNN